MLALLSSPCAANMHVAFVILIIIFLEPQECGWGASPVHAKILMLRLLCVCNDVEYLAQKDVRLYLLNALGHI